MPPDPKGLTQRAPAAKCKLSRRQSLPRGAEAPKRLQKQGEIGNLGAPSKPRYVTAEHFRPLQLAYEHIESRARRTGIRLSSKTSLSKGLLRVPAHDGQDSKPMVGHHSGGMADSVPAGWRTLW